MEKDREKASFEITSLTEEVERINKKYIMKKDNWVKEHRKWMKEKGDLLKSIADKK